MKSRYVIKVMKMKRKGGAFPLALGSARAKGCTNPLCWCWIIITYSIICYPIACKYRFKCIQVIYTIVTKL
jgi:hypothetical protein